MSELSNTTAQTVAAGQALTFNAVVLNMGSGEFHRENSGVCAGRINT